MVCVDEASKQLVADVTPPWPMQPGQPVRQDYEYERCGTANLFMVCQPLAGWRHVKVTDRRTNEDFANLLRDISENHFREAEKIVLVLDNLSTHKLSVLYRVLPPQEARRLLPDGSVETQIEEIPGTESEFTPAPFEIGDLSRSGRGRGSHGSRDWGGEPDQNGARNGDGRDWQQSESPGGDVDSPKPVVTRVFPFGIPKSAINEVIAETKSPVIVVDFADAAEIFVTTKSHYSRRPTAVRRAERDGVMVHVLRRGTKEQIKLFLKRFRKSPVRAQNGLDGDLDDLEQGGRAREALAETEAAIGRVVSGEHRVELLAQPPYVRRLQHGLAARNNLGSASMGREPARRLVIRRRKR